MLRRDGVEDDIRGHHHAHGFAAIVIEFFGFTANRCAMGRQPVAPSLSPTLDNSVANGLHVVRLSVPVRSGRCGLRLRVGPPQLLAQGGVRTAWFVTLIFS